MPTTKLGEGLLKIFDQGWLEQLGGQGVSKKFTKYSVVIDYFITRGVKTYLFMFLFIFIGCFYLLYLGSSYLEHGVEVAKEVASLVSKITPKACCPNFTTKM